MNEKFGRVSWAALALVTLLWAVCLLTALAVDGKTAGNAEAENAEAGVVSAPVETVTAAVEIKPSTETEVVHTPVPVVETPAPTPEVVSRYAGVSMTDAEREEMAAIVYLEAGNQCAEGQQAVAEVVFNRVISPDFPDTVHEVLHQRGQFSTAENIHRARAGQAQYDAIDGALRGPSILPEDVVFFSTKGENDRVWGRIEDHVFCYSYVWG